MSLQTWMEEFMPVPPSDAVTSEQEAIEHCLRKWKGLRAEAKYKHQFSDVPTGNANCALCLRHDDDCEKCSLALSRGGVACDDPTDDEVRSPYHSYISPRIGELPDPEPMIAALEAALVYEKLNR